MVEIGNLFFVEVQVRVEVETNDILVDNKTL